MDMTGCVIIKKKELDELYKELANLQARNNEELHRLQEELENEKEKNKPDNIDVISIIYDDNGLSRYPGRDGYLRIGRTIKSSINLSSGIYYQVRSLLREIGDQYDEVYLEKYNNLSKEMEDKYKKNIESKKDRLINKLPKYWISKKTMINIINQVF